MINNDFCRDQIGISPIIKGYRVLVRAPIMKKKTGSGIIISSSEYRNDHMRNANIGLVLKIGPSAFKDPSTDQFEVPVGSWIYYSKYDRSPLVVKAGDDSDEEVMCFFINDNHVIAELSEEDVKFLRGHYES